MEFAAACDGLILFTPEYNNSLPGVFKNAIDWMSSAFQRYSRIFRAKPIAVLGASPGNFGTMRSARMPGCRCCVTLGANPWFEAV